MQCKRSIYICIALYLLLLEEVIARRIFLENNQAKSYFALRTLSSSRNYEKILTIIDDFISDDDSVDSRLL
jgi:hypothetical protein